jgi:16S rRNA (guanine527-N7)-methyltransferase
VNPATEFRDALQQSSGDYAVVLTGLEIDRLTEYFELLNSWNSRLHLVAPMSPAEFARRHVLESLLMVQHLPKDARVADIGSGGGLPIVPCLIVRADISAFLIEASKKKAVFLREVLNRIVGLKKSSVIAERFEDIAFPGVDYVSCRAVEQFESTVVRIASWGHSDTRFIFFGGPGLKQSITEAGLEFNATLIPHSGQRFLYVASTNRADSLR